MTMTETNPDTAGFMFNNDKEDPFRQRTVKAGGKLAVVEARRGVELSEHFTALDGKAFTKLWLQNNDRLAHLNGKTGQMDFPIFAKDSPDGMTRDRVAVAFGEPEQEKPRSIIMLNLGEGLSSEQVKLAQRAFPEGVTIIAPVEVTNNSLGILIDDSASQKECILRDNDAVVGFYGMQDGQANAPNLVEPFAEV